MCTKGQNLEKKTEGLRCTSKGRKEGTGGRLVRVVVVISYGKGVIACKPYKRMCGAYFADFIDRNFNRMFEEVNKERGKNFMHDSDPSQNSAIAKRAMFWAQCTDTHPPGMLARHSCY